MWWENASKTGPRKSAIFQRNLWLPPMVIATLAAALAEQDDLADANAFIERLGHVVDGEGRDRGGDHGLHLDAGALDCDSFGLDGDSATYDLGGDIDEGERDGVAHGDEG